MQQNIVLDLFRDAGAFLEGHFLLTSGLHSPHYIEKFRVLERPEITARLCKAFADHFAPQEPTVVIGPMTGGIILAFETARNLGTKSIFTERVDGKMMLRRGFEIKPDDRVLILEDVVTTGGSLMEVIEVVKDTGATIVGIGLLVDRSGGKAQFGFPVYALMTLDVQTFEPDSCPLCRQGIPLIKPGRTGKT
ncbi:MAG: orotate phosphoribosyltransferase [Chlorobi bacterium]|nr:orotate phosphoribosyltransferase [Chlorobiota bacterium]